jgi:hypothetical protein
MPTLSNSMPDLDQLMRALFLVALLLYFIPAVFGLGISAERRRWFQRGAILTHSNCGGGERDMVLTLTPEHLAFDNGIDGFNQSRVIISPARHIDPFRDRPHAQKIVRRRPQ